MGKEKKSFIMAIILNVIGLSLIFTTFLLEGVGFLLGPLVAIAAIIFSGITMGNINESKLDFSKAFGIILFIISILIFITPIIIFAIDISNNGFHIAGF